jgi:hypothetical protein
MTFLKVKNALLPSVLYATDCPVCNFVTLLLQLETNLKCQWRMQEDSVACCQLLCKSLIRVII